MSTSPKPDMERVLTIVKKTWTDATFLGPKHLNRIKNAVTSGDGIDSVIATTKKSADEFDLLPTVEFIFQATAFVANVAAIALAYRELRGRSATATELRGTKEIEDLLEKTSQPLVKEKVDEVIDDVIGDTT